METIEKTINKIEIFRPKRKFNAPREWDYTIPKGHTLFINVSGIKLHIENTRTQNVFVRLK